MRVARFDLAAAFRASVHDVRADVGDWPIRLHVTAPDRLMIDGDDTRLRFVMETLPHNALTYGHPGGDVTATLSDPDGHVTLAIADAGIGIPADELEQVFERFHRGSRVRDLGIPGTGLGLPASRLIVHRHHGTITLRPTPGGGVTATVRLPRDQPPNGL